METFQDSQRAELAIYRTAYEMEKAGFNGCSRHANALLMLVGWANVGSWYAEEKAAYLAGRIIAGDYQ